MKKNKISGIFEPIIRSHKTMDKVKKLTKDHIKKRIDFKVGDTVKVHQRIKEGEKERVQIFEGLVISKKKPNDVSGMFTVRKVTSGVGVEKVFPIHSPLISDIQVVKSGKVRKSKLYYIRNVTSKNSRLKEIRREYGAVEEEEVPAEIMEEEAPEEVKEDSKEETKQEETEKEVSEEK